MIRGSAKWLLAVFIITGVLLIDLGAPVSGSSEALWSGKVVANVNLRKTPSLQGDIIAGLLRGSPVEIHEEKGGWYRVSVKKYHQVFQGWVSIEYVTIVIEETPAPPPVQKSRVPEAKAPAVSPQPETDKPAAAEPPPTKIVATKTERPSRIAKTPMPAVATEPEGGLTRLLPTALPVLAVIVLLSAVIAYRVKRTSGPKADIPDLPAKPAPPVQSPPVAANSLESAENEPAEEDLAVIFESQMESLHADLTAGNNGDRPEKDVPAFDLVMANIYRLSRDQLVEVQHLIEDQLGGNSRKEERLTFYTTVDYSVEGQYYRDFIQDLSVSGVFIKTRQMFEPGQRIMMTFMSPFLQKPFKISGEIVRTLDTGIGVKFDKESQVQAEAVSALLDQIRMVEEAM